MDLRSLRYFVAVADARSVGKAAQRLHMAQPPLSVQIRNLESQLGAQLFRRVSGGMQLTDAGSALLARAREALALAHDGFEAARAVAAGRRGRLTVGYMFALGYALLPQLVPKLRRAMPEVELQFVEMSTLTYEALIAELKVTVALCMPPIQRAGIAASVVGTQPLRVAMPARSPMARLRAIPLAKLQGGTLISLPTFAESADSSVVATLLRRHHVTMQIAHRVETVHSALALVMAGEGMAILPACAALGSPPGLVFKPLLDVKDGFDVAVCWRSDLDSPLLAPFIDCVRASMAQ
ncbi:LysR family transcriptional regulator [Variovorax sp. PBL-E5]|uniref:LysR family transcriptional regulator n=1 Tax=Variovorax sp. PBL-E5 TaxID=434014 RepID=UPI001317C504|nr:LysR family transcriptional regulator [Variovorax sp. PBL-E5]VTU45831.1 HTH-type transcriptional regulator TdfR [Variovorax sp. PBL-E5]